MKNGLVRDWSFHSLPSSSDPYVFTSLFFLVGKLLVHNIFGGYLQIKKLYSPRDISYFLLSMFFFYFCFSSHSGRHFYPYIKTWTRK